MTRVPRAAAQRWAVHAVVLAVFVVAAVVGRLTVIDGANLSLVCPAAGVGALWAAATTGAARRLALLGVATGTAAAYALTGASGEIIALVSTTNLVQAAVFAAVVRRVLPTSLPTWAGPTDEQSPDSARELAGILGSAALACLTGAVIGTIVVGLAGGGWDALGLCVWWGRNTIGMVTLSLVGLLGARRLRRERPAPTARARAARLLVTSAVAAGTFGVYLLVFHVADGDALAFVVLAPSLAVGLLCRPLTTALHGIGCTALAIGFTLREEGPFLVIDDLTARALVAQAFVLLTLAVGLALSFTRTHERQVVEELRASGARWELLLDSLPDMTVFTLGPSLHVGHVAGAGSWTTSLADAAGRSLTSLPTSADLAMVREMIRRALEGERVSADVPASATDREHHVVATALPASREHGAEVLVVARDVSGERAREREITAARDRAEQLFEAAPHGIVVLGADGTVHRANPALGRLLGRPHEGLLGASLAREAAPGDDDVLATHLAQVLADPDGTHEATWRIRDADGHVRVVTLSSGVLAGDTAPGGAEVLTTVVDVSEQVGLQDRLQYLAHHDPLTGLANRRWFEERLTRHLEEGSGDVGALLVIDLDHFKQVNDSLGHAAGDRLLSGLAAHLRTRLGPDDLLARLGGDEFAVLVPRVDLRGAERAAACVLRAVSEVTASLAGPERRVTASVGGVLLGGRDVPALLEAADRMLYTAKRRGRNQHVLRGSLGQPGGQSRTAISPSSDHSVPGTEKLMMRGVSTR